MCCRLIITLFAIAALLLGCGGASDVPATRSIIAPDVVLTASDARLLVADIPAGLHVDQRITFTLVSDGYYARNPVGHFAFITRSDISKWTTQVLGHGLAFGNLSGAFNGTPSNPGAQLESWCNGSTPPNYLLSAAPSPVLVDGVAYQVRLETHVSPDRSVQTLRYTIGQAGQLVYDSGVVLDPNRAFDPAMNGIWIAHVFDGPNTEPWAIRLSNIRIELP